MPLHRVLAGVQSCEFIDAALKSGGCDEQLQLPVPIAEVLYERIEGRRAAE